MKRNSGALKITILLVSCLTIMSIVTISPSLPEMSLAFSEIPNSEFLVKLVLTLPALFIALISPLAGALIDRYGRLKLLWFALLLYAVSGTSGYYLNDLYFILAGRALLGIAVGISMTIVVTLVADYFEGMERQKFAGLQIAFMSIGGILFIGLGGILADINWRFPFLIYLFALIILPLTILYLHEPTIELNKSKQVSKIKTPPIMWLLLFNIMIMWILFFLIPVQIPFYLKAIGIQQNALIGAAIAVSTAFSAISAFSYAKLKSRYSFFTIFSLGYLLMSMAFLLVAFIPSYMAVVLAMMLAGLGMGMMIPNTNIWVMKIAPPEIRGRAIGRLTTFWFLGQFLSPVLLLPFTNAFSLSSTFYLAAALLMFLSIAFLFLQLSTAKASIVH
ncbi:MAG: MFS transporter [Bacteroidota bacterium]|nr:MFS transporter [Bacteroidota bacterium]